MTMDDEVTAAATALPEADYPWRATHPAQEDRVAEAVALVALVFAIGVGLVIALLPVTVKATSIDLVRPVVAAPAPALSAPAR